MQCNQAIAWAHAVGSRQHLVPTNTREVGGERAGQAVLWGMHMQEEGVNPASGYTQDSALAVCRA